MCPRRNILTAIEASSAIKTGTGRRKIAEQILALQKP